jgi:hypothetical protein
MDRASVVRFLKSYDRRTDGRRNKERNFTIEELMVSNLAMADATVKLLIEKGVFTEEEFEAQLGAERANYLAVLKHLH